MWDSVVGYEYNVVLWTMNLFKHQYSLVVGKIN
jgi:hypothetical protein